MVFTLFILFVLYISWMVNVLAHLDQYSWIRNKMFEVENLRMPYGFVINLKSQENNFALIIFVFIIVDTLKFLLIADKTFIRGFFPKKVSKFFKSEKKRIILYFLLSVLSNTFSFGLLWKIMVENSDQVSKIDSIIEVFFYVLYEVISTLVFLKLNQITSIIANNTRMIVFVFIHLLFSLIICYFFSTIIKLIKINKSLVTLKHCEIELADLVKNLCLKTGFAQENVFFYKRSFYVTASMFVVFSPLSGYSIYINECYNKDIIEDFEFELYFHMTEIILGHKHIIFFLKMVKYIIWSTSFYATYHRIKQNTTSLSWVIIKSLFVSAVTTMLYNILLNIIIFQLKKKQIEFILKNGDSEKLLKYLISKTSKLSTKFSPTFLHSCVNNLPISFESTLKLFKKTLALAE